MCLSPSYSSIPWITREGTGRQPEVEDRAGFLQRRAGQRGLADGRLKQSGHGREMGVFGLEEFLEVKAILGFDAEAKSLPSFEIG